MTGFTPAERAILDRVSVPAMRPGLTADIVAAASAGRSTTRRAARGGWRRHGRVLVGVGALLVASATAAATGLLDRLPIRIPGITHIAAAPEPAKPKIAHAVRPHAKPAEEAPPAGAVAAPPPPPAPVPGVNWQRQQQRRAALIAAGIPPALARRPMLVRALAEQAGGPPAARRAAVIAEWQRLKALPPDERKAAIVKLRTDFLARHPQMAAKYEQRLEAQSIAAAQRDEPGGAAPQPGPQAALPDPQAANDRGAWRRWRMARRGWRLRDRSPAAAPMPDVPPAP